jgi:RNA polymerase sigma factor (sigma-70 family)
MIAAPIVTLRLRNIDLTRPLASSITNLDGNRPEYDSSCSDPRFVEGLLERAAAGDESVWQDIVRRYAPLIWSVCRRHRLSSAAAEDIAGLVWLRLVDGLATIREPAALSGWLATVTRRACLALLHRQGREIQLDERVVAVSVQLPSDAWLLAEERRIALREAFTQLPEPDRRLLSLVFSDPPLSYAEIGAILDMPIGSIGPTRQRCLDRLRRHPALAALLAA